MLELGLSYYSAAILDGSWVWWITCFSSVEYSGIEVGDGGSRKGLVPGAFINVLRLQIEACFYNS